jgi:pimeloyl-ACP methyl ester carboxylesterase
MRAAVAGFLIGLAAAAVTVLILQQIQIRPVVDQVGYHFDTCVFSGTKFPTSDLDNGRLLRRALVPSRETVRFFDARFNEVKRAAQPGRYGAVVKIQFSGGLQSYRFITLYRTPGPFDGGTLKIPITAQFPPELGIDPAVLNAQTALVGSELQDMLVDYENGHAPESFAILLAGLSEMSPLDPPEFMHVDADTRNQRWWYELRTRLKLAPTYRYIVDLPEGYSADPSKRWPLILFLHHSDAGGSDLDQVRNCALMKLIQNGRQVPAIVVAPQCPTAQFWNVTVLDHLLDTLAADYRVDPDRVYLTGVSSGGDATWDLATLDPGRFAALVPMSGDSDARDAGPLRGIPVWGFQGGKDGIAPPSEMEGMVDAIRQAGGHAHLTVYPDAGHDCWDRAYSTDALWTWLFAQKRGQPEVLTPGTPVP